MSTMNKTTVDWDNYKQQNAGLDEELAQYTKNGFLERRDFLNRVDWNQFELEREVRGRERAKREAEAAAAARAKS